MKLAMLFAAAVALTVQAPASAADMPGDPVAGEKVFKKCKACHKIEAGKKTAAGPNLLGVFGRQAGTADYKFSKSMIAAGEAGLVWTPELVDVYITDPKAFLQEYLGESKVRNKMKYKLKKEDQRADVIAYLMSLQE